MSAPLDVHLFMPCFVDQIFPQTGLATVNLLEKIGCKITFPREQTCCGQPAFNSGFFAEASTLAQRFIRIFAEAEAVVAPSASCVAMVRKHYAQLDLPVELLNIWNDLKDRVYELSEFLVDVHQVYDFGAKYEHRVAYHTSCHGYRELGIYHQPLELLSKVKGIDLVEPDDRHACCGFGGTFASKFPDLSVAIGDDKIKAIEETSADVVTATDDSCLMHIAGMISKKKLPIKTLHYSRILAGGEYLL